jgi:hypothetical protein
MLKLLVPAADCQFVRRVLPIAAALAALVLPGSAGAGLGVGVTDDVGRDSVDGGMSFVSTLGDLGFTENRVSVVWDPNNPATIPSQVALDRYVANAAAAGVRVVLAVYPGRPTAVADSPATVGQFAAFLAELARTYPQVTDFVVGNEPNQPAFWRPQFATTGAPIACAAYEPLLAASYDALKAVNPAITVIGLGLSPRGNDNATAADNPSTSPVRCLRDLGAAYRASRRTLPLMDELAFHAYPERDSQPFGVPYSWPKAGLSDLGRIKQAVWDAFNGTAQPTFAEPSRSVLLPSLMLRIAEVGWQVGVLPGAEGAYTGKENITPTDETNQALDYAQAIRLLSCDPAVRSLLFFGLQDETDLSRWQAGLVRADGTRRPSYDAVKTELAASKGGCAGTPVIWSHATGVVGVKTRFDRRKVLPAGFRKWGFSLTLEENATFVGGLFRQPRAVASKQWRALVTRMLAGKGGGVKPAVRLTGRAKAPWGRTVTFRETRLRAGYYVYAVRLAAEMNPARASIFFGPSYRLGPLPPKHKATVKAKKKPPRKPKR